ncbi:MAG TPA: hypothetical protein VK419_17365 [Bryobacteraceae bacterium]|nr:hypothetical protein [Bryobacteraceae bacterium]
MTRKIDEKVLNHDEALSRALRTLPMREPPLGLTSSLRVIASREQRRRLYGSRMADRFQLFFDNLMRPLALPLAGGVFSTIVLFSMWLVPLYPLRGTDAFDVPSMLTTQAAVKVTAPVPFDDADDVIVDVTIDGDGRMVDYKIVSGNYPDDQALRRSIAGVLLLTRFTPATSFGQPVEGTLRLSLSSSHIDVKG